MAAQVAFAMDQAVHLLHEGMKVDTTFRRNVCGFEKKIHQHGFSAPDITVKIDTLRRRGGTVAAEQGLKDANTIPARRLAKIVAQDLKPFDRLELGGVGTDLIGLDKGAIGLQRTVWHENTAYWVRPDAWFSGAGDKGQS